jgi:ABC-type amino acid transport system permease subunit
MLYLFLLFFESILFGLFTSAMMCEQVSGGWGTKGEVYCFLFFGLFTSAMMCEQVSGGWEYKGRGLLFPLLWTLHISHDV